MGLREAFDMPVVAAIKLVYSRLEELREVAGSASQSRQYDDKYSDGVKQIGSKRMTTISLGTLAKNPDIGEMALAGKNVDHLLSGVKADEP